MVTTQDCDAVDCDGGADEAPGAGQAGMSPQPGDWSGLEQQEAHARRLPYGLTSREMHVLELLYNGASEREIASTLGVSAYTASKHVSNILRKMNVESREQARTRSRRDRIFGE